MKTSAAIALLLAAWLAAPIAVSAQTDEPAPYRRHHGHHDHGPHHTVHRRSVAHRETPAPAAGAVETGHPQTSPMFKPYAHPGEGDDDGLSRDPDDCMKGCIGGNPG